MPINIRINLENLKESIIYFQNKTRQELYEYILLKNRNIFEGKKFIDLLRNVVKINLMNKHMMRIKL